MTNTCFWCDNPIICEYNADRHTYHGDLDDYDHVYYRGGFPFHDNIEFCCRDCRRHFITSIHGIPKENIQQALNWFKLDWFKSVLKKDIL
jgi:hypothetical protein